MISSWAAMRPVKACERKRRECGENGVVLAGVLAAPSSVEKLPELEDIFPSRRTGPLWLPPGNGCPSGSSFGVYQAIPFLQCYGSIPSMQELKVTVLLISSNQSQPSCLPWRAGAEGKGHLSD